ncbi:hypothetical protein B0H10DRAFT_1949701 [Mycena sp. CBHHK59/15]|nr:hypothetical protein B0H10DRAFT_1949701 [Mycena sp. CBHHK59/15]
MQQTGLKNRCNRRREQIFGSWRQRPAAFSRFYHGTKPSAASLIPNQSTLWRFLGANWLSTTDENDMLELLRERVAGDPELVGSVRIESAYLSDKLAHAFKKRDSVNYEDPGMRWLNSLGNDIFCHGERLITIAHLGAHNTEKHWIAVDVDGPKRMLRYGDSFGEEIPPLLRAAFESYTPCRRNGRAGTPHIRRAARRARRAGSTGPVRRVADPFRRGFQIFFDGTATGRLYKPTAGETTAGNGQRAGNKYNSLERIKPSGEKTRHQERKGNASQNK